jgi:hypothetical protein
MASTNCEFTICFELRPCFVKGQKALFHRWVDENEVIPPSPCVGGHGGAIVKRTLGIIEREDGSIHKCYPEEIIFCDGIFSQMAFPPEKEGNE